MGNYGRPLNWLILVCALSILTVDCESRSPNKKASKMNTRADTIWSKITLHAGLDREEVRSCQLEAGCIEQVITHWNLTGISGQADAVEDLANLGRQWVESRGEAPGHFGPFLADESIVGTIVTVIAKSTDPDFLDDAMKVLAKRTPDSLVRNHAAVLESVLAPRQDLRWKGLLIGKLGSQRGLRIIEGSKSYLEGNPREGLAVLGKLGRKDAEAKLIEAYLQEKDGTQKERIAELMGYMGTPKALNILAADLRTPFTYAWNQMAQRSFRIHVIEALSIAYPFEPLLWVPFYRPTGDAYYEQIEDWAVKTLGVVFTRPRPPFLYQEDAPMMRPR
jgi:hypothetical protein